MAQFTCDTKLWKLHLIYKSNLQNARNWYKCSVYLKYTAVKLKILKHNFTKIAEYGVLVWASAVKFEAKFTNVTSNLNVEN